MKHVRAVKWSYILLPAFLSAVAAFADPATAARVFQMRLVVAQGPQSARLSDAERMQLIKTNSATGQTYGEILWVSKTVLIDQNDLQTTTVVTSTLSTSNVPGTPEIDVTFTPKGSKRFAEVTRQNINNRLAIIIDGQIVSAPVIKTEIPGGKAMIDGSFTQSEAKELSSKINQALKK
jgi:preprotein translocase subunit SecD